MAQMRKAWNSRSEATCQNGHALHKSTWLTLWYCDGCRRDSEPRMPRFRCELCDFDLCERCVAEQEWGQAGQTIVVPSRPPPTLRTELLQASQSSQTRVVQRQVVYTAAGFSPTASPAQNFRDIRVSTVPEMPPQMPMTSFGGACASRGMGFSGIPGPGGVAPGIPQPGGLSAPPLPTSQVMPNLATSYGSVPLNPPASVSESRASGASGAGVAGRHLNATVPPPPQFALNGRQPSPTPARGPVTERPWPQQATVNPLQQMLARAVTNSAVSPGSSFRELRTREPAAAVPARVLPIAQNGSRAPLPGGTDPWGAAPRSLSPMRGPPEPWGAAPRSLSPVPERAAPRSVSPLPRGPSFPSQMSPPQGTWRGASPERSRSFVPGGLMSVAQPKAPWPSDRRREAPGASYAPGPGAVSPLALQGVAIPEPGGSTGSRG